MRHVLPLWLGIGHRLTGTKTFVYKWWRKINCMRLHLWREDKFWRFNSKWLYGNQEHTVEAFIYGHWWHWRQQLLLSDNTRFDFKTSTSCKFPFRSMQSTKLLFSVLFTVFVWKYAYFAPNKPSAQIFLCHVTDVKYCDCFGWLHYDTIGHWWPRVSGIFPKYSLKKKCWRVKSVGTKVDFWEKCTYLKFLTRWIKHLTSQGVRLHIQALSVVIFSSTHKYIWET